MNKNRSPLRTFASCLVLAALLCAPAPAESSLKSTVDGIVTRFYATLEPEELAALNHESVLRRITPEEREVLATEYWTFDVNVPVVVSLCRNVDQAVVPFWIPEAGFKKTNLVVKNENWTHEVWQKEFDAGRVELGINGFDRFRSVYFVCVGPQKPGDKVTITNLFPEKEAVIEMKKGAWTYRDWDSLVIESLPESLESQHLLTTFRGRAWEAHLVGAFRQTPFPSSTRPDHVVLTWSQDPRTTQTIQWRTNPSVKDGRVRYRPKSAETTEFTVARAAHERIEDRLLMNDRYIHRHTAELTGLQPATSYLYSVGSPSADTWSTEARFTTAPDPETPFSFIYFGDTHNSAEWGRVLQTIPARHPEIAFYTIAGDVVNTGLFRDDWDKFFAYAGDAFMRRPLMFSLGNHDQPDGLGSWMAQALMAYPTNGPDGVEPERNYSFRYGNALFLVCDVDTSPEIQADWMDEQLAATDAAWKVVIFHFPLYYLGPDDEYAAIRRRWEQVFAKYHVDLMLTGHVHYYQRTHPMRNGKPVDSPADGTIHLISLATKGRKRSRSVDVPDYVEKVETGGLWYQKIDIDRGRLTYNAYDADGNVFDKFVIEK